MIEAFAVGALTVGGMALLDRPRIDRWMRIAIAPAFGVILYLVVGTLAVSVVGRVEPSLSLSVTLGVMLAFGFARRRALTTSWRDIAWAVGWTALVAIIVLNLSLARVTADSFRYVINGNLLTEPTGLDIMNKSDLVKRITAAPLLQTFGHFDDRRYSLVAGPVVGMAGWLVVARIAWRMGGDRPWARWALMTLTLASIAAANRPLFNLFYVNSHGLMATATLIAVYAGWHAARGNGDWLLVLAVSTSVIPVARAEGGALIALIWAGLLSMPELRIHMRIVAAAILPALVSTAWFGLVAIPRGLQALRMDALLILGSAWAPTIIVLMAVAAPRIRTRLGAAAVAVATGLLVIFAISEPEVLIDSLDATITNLTGGGAWGATWPALVLLLVLALGTSPPGTIIWSATVAGYAIGYWLLIYLRDGGYRVGAGDSGNRLLAHIFLVAVAYLLLAFGDRRSLLAPDDI